MVGLQQPVVILPVSEAATDSETALNTCNEEDKCKEVGEEVKADLGTAIRDISHGDGRNCIDDAKAESQRDTVPFALEPETEPDDLSAIDDIEDVEVVVMQPSLQQQRLSQLEQCMLKATRGREGPNAERPQPIRFTAM